MGCDEVQDNIDYVLINFFSSKNEKEELSVFLVETKSIPNTIKTSKNNKILNFITDNIEQIEILSEYEECINFSKKEGNEFYIVSEDYMEKICSDLNEIKDKKAKIKKIKKRANSEDDEEDKRIQFTISKNGFYSLISEFNPLSLSIENYNYYIICK